MKLIFSSEFCHYGHARDLKLIHIYERINGLFQPDCPADELFGRQFPGCYVAAVAETDEPFEDVTPLYSAKHRLHSGKQVLTVRTSERPWIVALDPFHKRIERSAGNNKAKFSVPPEFSMR